MGLSHIYEGRIVSGNYLNLEQFNHIGFAKTYSANSFTADSGAGGTALACGVKTNNGMIGMTPESIAVESILRIAQENGFATGMVTTCNITDATPESTGLRTTTMPIRL